MRQHVTYLNNYASNSDVWYQVCVFIGNGRENENNTAESSVRKMALLTKRWKDEQLIIKLSKAMTDEEFSRIKDHLHGNDNIYIRSFKIFFL